MKEYKYIGKRIIREDAADKVRGAIKFLADEPPSGCLFGVPLFSPYANAVVKSLVKGMRFNYDKDYQMEVLKKDKTREHL